MGAPCLANPTRRFAEIRGRALLARLRTIKEVLSQLLESKAFLQKGPRVAMRRWFSWVDASVWHDQVWHSRLLAIIYMGLQSGVYKSPDACPLWGGETAPRAEGSDSEDEKEKKEAGSLAIVAASASKEASKKGEVEADPAAQTVKGGDEDLKTLRKKCKHTL